MTTLEKTQGKVYRGYGSLSVTNREVQNLILSWGKQFFIMDRNSSEKLKDLYASYTTFCAINGLKECSKPIFLKVLQLLFEQEFIEGSLRIVTRSGRHILGVRLNREGT